MMLNGVEHLPKRCELAGGTCAEYVKLTLQQLRS